MFYEFPKSSAIFSVKTENNRVVVVYNSKNDKEYQFDCQNVQEFELELTNTLKNAKSIGKLVHSYIKEGKLVAVTK